MLSKQVQAIYRPVCWFRGKSEGLLVSYADNYESLAHLGDTVIGSEQHLVLNRVSVCSKGIENLTKQLAAAECLKVWDILEHKSFGLQFANKASEMKY